MKPLRNIGFVAENVPPGSPARHLLERFLIGYPRDGEFRGFPECRVTLNAPDSKGLESHVTDYGLRLVPRIVDAVEGADAVVVIPREGGRESAPALVEEVLGALPRGGRCFVHDLPTNDLITARRLFATAAEREITLSAGRSTAVADRLPEVDLPLNATVREALIVTQGPFPEAELDGLSGLLALLGRRRNGESGVKQIRQLKGDAVWRGAKERQWSWPLLAAALSRSNTIQGDPVKDGRTQNVAGLGLVPALARSPRAWLLEHHDRVQSTILALDGVLTDVNFAVLQADGAVVSAQLYRPPAPMLDGFSRLVGVMEDFFRSGTPPWPAERDLLTVSLIEAMRRPEAQSGKPVELPPLHPPK